MTNIIRNTNRNSISSVAGISSYNEAMKKFGIDFTVDRVPMYTNINNVTREIPQKEAIVRIDTGACMGIVSSKYPIINPYEKFKAYERIAESGIIEFIDGGAIGKHGGTIYLQARIKDSMNLSVKKGEIIEKRITFLSSYDGSKQNEIVVNPYRLVCENGMVIPEKALTSFKVRNSKYSENRLVGAIEVMEEIILEYIKIDELFYALMDTEPLTPKEVNNFIEKIIPSEITVDKTGKLSAVKTRTANRRASLLETIKYGIGQEQIKTLNLWKILQGVTCFTNNVEGAKKQNHFEYTHFGTGADLSETAFELVTSALSTDYSVFS